MSKSKVRDGDGEIGDCISNGTKSLLNGIDEFSPRGSRESIYDSTI